jgi:hypothetical protein
LGEKSQDLGELLEQYDSRTAIPLLGGRPIFNSYAPGEVRDALILIDEAAVRVGQPSHPWNIGPDTPLAPLVFADLFEDWKLTKSDIFAFTRISGDRQFVRENTLTIHSAISTLLFALAFPEVRQQWKVLAAHVQKVIKFGDSYLQLMRQPQPMNGTEIILSPAATVYASLMSSPLTKDAYRSNISAMETTVKALKIGLEKLKPQLPKRGGKPDTALHLFLSDILDAAGENWELPSNEDKNNPEVLKKNALLRFTGAIIAIALREGKKVYEQSSLSKTERDSALRALREISNKSNGSLIDHLRTAKKIVSRNRGELERESSPQGGGA